MVLGAATYIVPPDADLIRSADAIAIVHVQSGRSYRTPDGSIATDVMAVVERALKSPLRPGMEITITQRGGVIGDAGLRVSSEPRLVAGERALLMLERVQDNRFRTISGELGKFGSDREIFGWELSGRAHVERARDEARFVRYIERVVAGENPPADYFVNDDAPLRPNNHVASGHEYLLDGARWQDMGFTLHNKNNEGAENGGIVAQNAAAIWNGASDADIDIDYGGVNANAVFLGAEGENNILFDQSPADALLKDAVIGVAAVSSGGQHSYRSVTYASILECDVMIETGLSGSLLISVTAHELGHCLGFRHSNQPAAGQVTTTNNALMYSRVDFDFSLRQWDEDAASHVYGDGGPACTPPSISTPPASIAITEGNTTTLTVTAGGSALSYQWFIGASGTTTVPTGGNTPSLLVGPLSTTSYWVRVTGACGSADSAAAVVTVNPGPCVSPLIVNHPASHGILVGQTTTLSVAASGSGLDYQWFIGESGDTTSPTGTNSSTLTADPSSTTSYWVRVTGACGSPVDSDAATVTVIPCPEVTLGTPVAAKQPNGSYVLAIAASSGGRPMTIHWFRGTTPGRAGIFLGTSTSLFVPAPTASVSYWALVENDCRKSTVSPLVTIAPLKRRAARH